MTPFLICHSWWKEGVARSHHIVLLSLASELGMESREGSYSGHTVSPASVAAVGSGDLGWLLSKAHPPPLLKARPFSVLREQQVITTGKQENLLPWHTFFFSVCVLVSVHSAPSGFAAGVVGSMGWAKAEFRSGGWRTRGQCHRRELASMWFLQRKIRLFPLPRISWEPFTRSASLGMTWRCSCPSTMLFL